MLLNFHGIEQPNEGVRNVSAHDDDEDVQEQPSENGQNVDVGDDQENGEAMQQGASISNGNFAPFMCL